MIAFKSLIEIQRDSDLPVYLQIHNAVIHLIKRGVLASGLKLPGSRLMASQLGVHRKTVIAAYDELMSQGWITAIPSKGTFISEELPVIKPQGTNLEVGGVVNASFEFDRMLPLQRVAGSIPTLLTLDEGIPDVRLAPINEILRNYRSIISRTYNAKHLGYGPVFGDQSLRNILSKYLHETRGLKCDPDQILITRGSQMAMYLSSQLLHKSGGLSIVGNTNYIAASLTLEHAGAQLLKVEVDEKGLNTKEIESLCQKHKIQSVYVTSHHHHPTTVTMSADRRLHLVELARKYNFAILEDDYDFDFHYQHAPLLPLASIDVGKQVIYMGALCKIVAPAIRIGYMVGPKEFIESAGHLRRIIDRQGDAIMERAIGQMIEQGDIQRHSRKALKIYHQRRDHFCGLLTEHLSDYLTFKKPEGGMAVWVKLNKGLYWESIAKSCLGKNLIIPNHESYDRDKTNHNGIRMGFASLNLLEQERVIGILKEVILEQMAKNLN